MTLSEISYFVTAYRSKSLSQAAQELNISQQGLGKAIRSLERELGVQLLVRTPQGIAPTDIGKRVGEDLAFILYRDKEIRRYTAEYRKSKSQSLRFACSRSQLGTTIARVVEEYNRTTGGAVEFFFTDEADDIQEEKLRTGAYDIRMISQELNLLADYPLVPILTMHFSLFANAANALCQQSRVPFEELDGRPVIIDGFSHSYVKLLRQRCAALHITPQLWEISDRFYAVKQLAARSDALYFAASPAAEMVTALSGEKISRVALEPPLINTICLQFRGAVDQALVQQIRSAFPDNG